MLHHDPMRVYRAKRDAARKTVQSKYTILGFISSGTYGRVYKAQSKPIEDDDGELNQDVGTVYAIKKFKPDKEGEVITYTGISQSAIREIAVSFLLLPVILRGANTESCVIIAQLNRELNHQNVVALREVILEDKSIYMVFEYAEHDFLVPSSFGLVERQSKVNGSANHTPLFFNPPKYRPSFPPQILHPSTFEWSGLPPLMSYPPSRLETCQHPNHSSWCRQDR